MDILFLHVHFFFVHYHGGNWMKAGLGIGITNTAFACHSLNCNLLVLASRISEWCALVPFHVRPMYIFLYSVLVLVKGRADQFWDGLINPLFFRKLIHFWISRRLNCFNRRRFRKLDMGCSRSSCRLDWTWGETVMRGDHDDWVIVTLLDTPLAWENL